MMPDIAGNGSILQICEALQLPLEKRIITYALLNLFVLHIFGRDESASGLASIFVKEACQTSQGNI